MIVLLIISAAVMFFLLMWEFKEGLIRAGLIMIVGAMLTACIVHCFIGPNPTALDVYRGKTTLEITYRDSVAIDSTVVYKVK